MRKKITIHINGEKKEVPMGDTVLAALLGSGHKILKTSRKLNQNRGPLCGMGVCYECQVTIDEVPGQRACMTEVEDSMTVITHES